MPVSWMSELCSCPGPQDYKDPALGLMFYYHHLEILNCFFFEQDILLFHVAQGPTNYAPLLGRGIRGHILLSSSKVILISRLFPCIFSHYSVGKD